MIITSRNEISVAMRGDTTCINFKPECLSNQDSWTLFQRIAMPMKDASGKHSNEGIFDNNHILLFSDDHITIFVALNN